jgi:hypothetical protein
MPHVLWPTPAHGATCVRQGLDRARQILPIEWSVESGLEDMRRGRRTAATVSEPYFHSIRWEPRRARYGRVAHVGDHHPICMCCSDRSLGVGWRVAQPHDSKSGTNGITPLPQPRRLRNGGAEWARDAAKTTDLLICGHVAEKKGDESATSGLFRTSAGRWRSTTALSSLVDG